MIVGKVYHFPITCAQVRLVDQEKINEFGRLNNRLLEIRAEIVQCKTDAEKLDDASAEMMMSTDGKFMLLIGESFVEVNEDYANDCKFLACPCSVAPFALLLILHV